MKEMYEKLIEEESESARKTVMEQQKVIDKLREEL
jgi:hypothetical protein